MSTEASFPENKTSSEKDKEIIVSKESSFPAKKTSSKKDKKVVMSVEFQEDMTSEIVDVGQPDNTYPDSININTVSTEPKLKIMRTLIEYLRISVLAQAYLKSLQGPKTTKTPKLMMKKTGKFYDENNPIPTYKTSSKKRGKVFIINNIMFEKSEERIGARNDDKNLKTVFEQMGFTVKVKHNLTASEMQKALKEFSQKPSLEYVDIGVIIVMSHGTKNKTIGGTEVFGVDEKGMHVDDITNNFNEKECKMLKGKPKIFIFQCCRGDNEQFVQTDSIRTDFILTNALVAYSTLPGFKSYRAPEIGTYYINTLCNILCDYAHEHHVEDLLKIVEDKLKNVSDDVRQTTHYENRGFKRCYFHPV